MFNIIKLRKIGYIFSALIMAVAIGSLIVFGLNLGIDFKGGSLATLQFSDGEPEINQLQEKLNELGYTGATIQRTETATFNIRTVELSQEQYNELKDELAIAFGPFEELRYDRIGPTISREIATRAGYQLFLVTLGILGYIAWAFRRVPKPLSSWNFGFATIASLAHDLFVIVGLFALLGHFLNVEVDTLFVTAILTTLGYTVLDTIIVFDRVRENLKLYADRTFDNIMNTSIKQTIVRSINTSTTVVFVLLAILLFGGETIRFFTLALLVGVIAGTYSSIFVASPLLYDLHKKKLAKRA